MKEKIKHWNNIKMQKNILNYCMAKITLKLLFVIVVWLLFLVFRGKYFYYIFHIKKLIYKKSD